MGSNESATSRVAFNRPNSSYFAGEQIEGNISYQNTHHRLVLDEIFLEFIGELGYTTEEKRNNNEDSSNLHPAPYTIYHRILFENIRLSVANPSNGQREIILNHGRNSWPFKFTLPEHLPPSLISSKVAYPYVKYYVRVTIFKPWYKPNTKHVYPLTIFPRVTLQHIYGSQQPVPFSYFNRKKVHLAGCLVRAGIVPNQRISIQINLQNPKHCVIKRIEAILIRHHQVAENHHEDRLVRIELPDVRDFNGTELRRTFNIQINSIRLAPSYKFIAEFEHQKYPIIIKYKLALKVKSHGMLTDFEVKIPVIVGTELVPNPEEQQQMNGSAEAFMASASISDCDEAPPSYETVLSNTM